MFKLILMYSTVLSYHAAKNWYLSRFDFNKYLITVGIIMLNSFSLSPLLQFCYFIHLFFFCKWLVYSFCKVDSLEHEFALKISPPDDIWQHNRIQVWKTTKKLFHFGFFKVLICFVVINRK